MKYPLLPLSESEKYYKQAENLKVSIIARSKYGWYYEFRKNKGNYNKMPDNLKIKRDAFIARTYAAYKLNPTLRRYLSLIMWNFKPKKLHS
jgi:hypothetical protein